MIEAEIQNLTAAIKELVEVLRNPPKFAVSLEAKEESEADRAARVNFEDDANRQLMQAQRDEQLANLYKAEQAKAKRKAKVTPEETKALAAAAREDIMDESGLPVGSVEVLKEQSPKSPEPAIISANITEGDLKTMALEIARADSSARPLILSILSLHGAKTITQLDPKHYQEVHAELMSIAYDIAKNGEVTQ